MLPLLGTAMQRGISPGSAQPSRLAAQQLASLAGLSQQAQQALLHSQLLFEQQAAVVEQAVLARVFYVRPSPGCLAG
jgi:hypothetical protein